MKPKKIVLHHSLTRDSDTVSWGAIRRYHVEECGWSDIGYHFGIENMRGQVEIVMGRMPDKRGAHCRNHNSDSIGICFVGNFDNEEPSEEMWEEGLKLVRYLMREFSIGVENIKGHVEFNPHKSCPGKLFDLDAFRGAL